MGYDMYSVGETQTYHRLNIFGMAAMRTAMWKLGMLNENAQPPDFPDWREGMTPDEEEAYSEACNEVRDFVPTPITGIPTYKLCSNDGWCVNSEEIEEALRHYESVSETQVTMSVPSDIVDVFRDWIAFLRLARKEGGFTVY